MTKEKILQLLDYVPESGKFFWRKSRGCKKAGDEAGSINGLGYKVIMINKLNYSAHRLAWLVTFGSFPQEEIDHINRNKADNRLCNLREANRVQNSLNSAGRSTKTHGVTWVKTNRKYRVVFRVKGKDHYFGYYTSKDEALRVAQLAKEKLGIQCFE